MQQPLTICIPVYNDWSSLERLLQELDEALSPRSRRVRVLVLDDGSEDPPPPRLTRNSRRTLECPRLVRLKRNLGHQRAIAVGLCLLASENEPCSVLIMDGDGEDDPDDAHRLIERFESLRSKAAVFASRAKRSESLLFRIGYRMYRVLHRALTGIPVRVGNFSILPWEHVQTLVVAPELWSHYAAAVVKCRLAVETIPADRRERYAGQSKMNLVSLVVHGLSAFSVFADIVGVRLLLATLLLMVLSSGALVGVIAVRAFTDLAIAGWATTAAGLLALLNFQAFLMALTLAFIILFGRNARNTPPISEFRLLVVDWRAP